MGATLVVLAPLAWLQQASLLPGSYSVMDMGVVDTGGAALGHHRHEDGVGRGVDTIVETATDPVVHVELAARKDGDRYTLNGTSPGPEIRVEQGQLVEVRLVNESVPDGATLHWHGVDVPNSADGVAGVTQDAVPVGGSFTYRFLARQVGTFWYHSHQLSHEQVRNGLLGAIVITPPGGVGATDVTALVHIYDGTRTVNGRAGDSPAAVGPGERVRVRVVNTDEGPMPVWVSGSEFRLVAIDGTEVQGPTPVRDVAVLVTAGARADLELVVPPGGARVEMGGSAALVLGAASARTSRPARTLDPLSYGTPADIGFDPAAANRRFDYVIGRRPGFVDGWPGVWWTINGGMFPDVPMFVVAEGDVVRMRIENTSGEVHPMHLHGHHAVVLSHNGVAATGSPWWVDSLDVPDGEMYEVAFRADNPGIWVDHCHNLPHAAEGLMAHLMYEGVTTPYRVGHEAGNTPE
ncbi:multicopper oxidase family protein [Pseudonocardia sp. TRM90224]|uniref:multicopper oxidase family protein n=1 Tax=Pseudonocardia sp. TRM90224 TaxID=2812678 RepID=UPI001E342274|nr:multicopper oxidase family protein [Pseudonocardia sp. TRM90224]